MNLGKRWLGSLILCSALLGATGLAAAEPEQLRQQVEALVRKAKELAADGREEDATRVREEAERLLRRAREAGGERPGPDQVRKQAEMMLREARELAERGHREEAERLRDQAEQLMRRINDEDRAERPGPDQLRKQAEAMLREARGLAERGHREEAERLRDRAEQMMRRMNEEDRAERPGPDQVWKQVEMMLREARELAENGRGDEADRVREEARRLAERAKEPGREGPPEEARLQHLRQAVEHLRAAGLHDWAEKLMQQMEKEASGRRNR